MQVEEPQGGMGRRRVTKLWVLIKCQKRQAVEANSSVESSLLDIFKCIHMHIHTHTHTFFLQLMPHQHTYMNRFWGKRVKIGNTYLALTI